jgi:hypothetical protein
MRALTKPKTQRPPRRMAGVCPMYVRVRGWSRRTVDTPPRPGDDHCTSVFGQLRSFPGFRWTSELQQVRTFPIQQSYICCQPEMDIRVVFFTGKWVLTEEYRIIPKPSDAFIFGRSGLLRKPCLAQAIGEMFEVFCILEWQ